MVASGSRLAHARNIMIPPSDNLSLNEPIKRATIADQGLLLDMLVRAFDSDPLTCWFVRKDVRHVQGMRRLFLWYLREVLPLGWSHTMSTHHAAALWLGPGQWKMPLLRQIMLLPEIVQVVGIDRLISRLKGMNTLQDQHPTLPHFYLAVVGTDPVLQGKGLGSRVLRAGLERCDAMDLPAYLETANQRNLSLYERHGFQLIKQIVIPDGGPNVWLMWRKPRGDL